MNDRAEGAGTAIILTETMVGAVREAIGRTSDVNTVHPGEERAPLGQRRGGLKVGGGGRGVDAFKGKDVDELEGVRVVDQTL